jgi:hypothetical protein
MEDRTTPVRTAPPIGNAQTAAAARRERFRMAPAAARRERFRMAPAAAARRERRQLQRARR